MDGRDVVVAGASAGGLQALKTVIGGLPSSLPAALFVVMHSSRDSPGYLANLIDRAGPLPAAIALDGGSIEHGRVYVAPPDHHLVIEPGVTRVTRGPRENGFRPAVDPLFRSAARAYGPRVVSVLLSGGLDDGAHGTEVVHRHGGVTIAQDPSEAVVPSMPESAIRGGCVDHVLPAAEIARLIPRLAVQRVAALRRPARSQRKRADTAAHGADLHEGNLRGPPTVFTCPECGGTLWDVSSGDVARFRCHVGHAFTGTALMQGQDGHVEQALWIATRALEERSKLRRRMAERAERGGLAAVARGYSEQAAEAEQQAHTLRQLLARLDDVSIPNARSRRDGNPRGRLARAVRARKA